MNGALVSVVIVGLFLVIVFVALVIWSLRQSSSANEKLERQEEAIYNLVSKHSNFTESMRDQFSKISEKVETQGSGEDLERVYHVVHRMYNDFEELGAEVSSHAKVTPEQINALVEQNIQMRLAVIELQNKLKEAGTELQVSVPGDVEKFGRVELGKRERYASEPEPEVPQQRKRRSRHG